MATNPAEAVRDALVLLNAFTSFPWRNLETKNGPMRLSISKMTAAERTSLQPASHRTSLAVETAERLLTAPHVSNLKEIAAAGTIIHAGERYAVIEILDRTIELRAIEAFIVISQKSQPGSFLEFGSPLIAIKPA